jgi:hypothetical protein
LKKFARELNMKTKNIFGIIVCLLIFGLTITSCNRSTPTPDATPAETVAACSIDPTTNQPVLYGLWTMEDQATTGVAATVLTVTEKSVYLVENSGSPEKPALRESFFEIDSVDWVNSVVTMNLKWVRVNGDFSGFSTPLRYLKVNIADDQLFYSLGDEGQGIPTEAKIGPFAQQ